LNKFYIAGKSDVNTDSNASDEEEIEENFTEFLLSIPFKDKDTR